MCFDSSRRTRLIDLALEAKCELINESGQSSAVALSYAYTLPHVPHSPYITLCPPSLMSFSLPMQSQQSSRNEINRMLQHVK